LEDLTNIIMKYMPVEDATEAERGNVLFDLFQLSSDLKKHTSIEDRLLIPSVEQLERRAV
jgi:regulator of cell morphogenesis and NO signaling